MLEVILETIESSVKSPVNTEERILEWFKSDPTITVSSLAERLNLSTRAVEKQLAKLKKEGRVARVGSARKGYWDVRDEV